MKVAALDLGSNTFLCLICDVHNGQIGQVYADEVQVVRLGQELSLTKKFHPEALARAKKTLSEFSKVIKQHQPDKILAMATSAARDAKNQEELFKICKDLSIPLKIISGDDEARITYSGSTSGLRELNKNYLVLDVGGGSTEFIFGKGRELIDGHSQNVGCVRFTEKFITAQPTPTEEVEKCKVEIQKYIKESKDRLEKATSLRDLEILAVAGTPTTLVAAELGKFDVSQIDGYRLSKEKLVAWQNKLARSTLEQKLQMGIPAGRADVLLVGVLILLSSLEIFGQTDLVVSTRGVRYGVALSMEKN